MISLSLEALGEDLFLCHFHLPEAVPFLLRWSHYVAFSPAAAVTVRPSSSVSQISLCLPPTGTLVIALRVHLDNPE